MWKNQEYQLELHATPGLGEQCPSRKVGEKIYVLDTTSLLAAIPLHAYSVLMLAPPSVIAEVKDRENVEKTGLGLTIGRIKVHQPSSEYVRRIHTIALKIGETGLSSTDIDVAALALEIKNLCNNVAEVLVITDDYALQNLLSHIGINYMPFRTTGIKEKRRYIVLCPVCGYRAKSINEEICPVCGTRLVKKPVRRQILSQRKIKKR